MKKLLCALLTLALLLPCLAFAADNTVVVYNWEDYIDPAVLDLFEEETGIHVEYKCFTTNEDMLVQVEHEQGTFDVVFPSEYCVEYLLSRDQLDTIDYSLVPNFEHISSWMKNPDYDPENAHSIPYMWGTVGILYNTEMVSEPVTSWSALFDQQFAGSVFMLDSFRDSMGVTLVYLGYSMNTRDPLALRECRDKLIEQKTTGVLKAYQVDETKEKMVNGEAAIALMWSGDAQWAIDQLEEEENPDMLAYVTPEEGTNVWVDCMVIPKNAPHRDNAHALINFLCRPDIAQMNCEYIGYSSPNTGAIELMGEEYTENTVQNPSAEDVANCEYYHDLDETALKIWNNLWQQVKNAK